MTEPIPFKVTRYRCPHCPRTASRPVRIREHMTRCWLNPAAKGCKTCEHFDPYDTWSDNESCKAGVDLTGRPECKTCGGFGNVPGEDLGMTECPDCGGDGAEIKPGPIVHCDRWEAAPCCGYHDGNSVPCAPDDQGGYCCDNCPTLAAHQARLAPGETL